MHPYREVSRARTARPLGCDPEELVAYVLLVLVGAIPVASALLAHEHLGADSTIGALMMALGVLGIVCSARP